MELLYEEIRRCGLEIDEFGHFDSSEVLKAINREITHANTRVHVQIFMLLNPGNAATISMTWFKTVTTLVTGENFGNLALQYHKPRAATIICKEKSSFATLSRFDYMQVIGKESRRKMKKIVEQMKNYRILSHLRANTIAKIFQYMKKVQYTRGRTIYKEGDSQVESVYFITDGEFEVTKAIKADYQEHLDSKGNPTALERKLKNSPIKS